MNKIKKTILTLALLLTAATGAWADESETITTTTKNTTVYTGTHFKITASYSCDADGIYLFSNNNHGTATIESLNGENITKIEMHMTCGGGKATKTTTTAGQLVATNSIDSENDISVINVNATSVEIGTTVEASDGTVVQIDKYVIYYGAAASSGTPFPLTWDPETPNTAIIDKMPAGNVIVNVEYYDYATLADNSVTAATDAAANTDAKLLTVADGATTEGTLMYAIGESNTTAPTTGWSDKVPTADGLHNDTNTDVYVWYYIKGDDTHSDTEPKCITVTVLPEPTYTVSLNKTDMAEGEPAKWSAKSTNVTTAVNLGEADLEGVKKSETVTVTYSGTRKIIGVKAEKKAEEKTITIDEQLYTVLNGETWSQFITRNQLSGWSVKKNTETTWIVCKDNQSATLHVSSDGPIPTLLELTTEDAPIDTDKQYTWAYEY